MKRTTLFRITAMLGILIVFFSLTIAASAQTNVLEPVFMFPEDILRVACLDGGALEVQLIGSDKAQIFCNSELPPPTTTPTDEPPTPTPTETEPPGPTPTATTPPPSTPTPTEPPTGSLPLCTDHDPRAYHRLISADGSCHYNHEHGDNPHEVDNVFGTEIYDTMGGEISYPWETPDENLYKHGGYAWYVRSDLDVSGPNAEGCTPYAPGCFRNIRALAHGVGEVRGNVVAFHSFYMEAELCLNGECGIVRVGGWQGPHTLFVDDVAVLPRANDGQRVFLSYFNTGNRCCSTWYNGLDSQIAGVVVEFGDMWNTIPVPPDLSASEADKIAFMIENSTWRTPDGQFTVNTRNNSSYRQLHIATFGIPRRLYDDFGFVNGDTHFNANGYLDRYGEVNPNCVEIGLDCVPFSFENVPATNYQIRSDYREYDVPQNGNLYSGWIEPQIQLP